MRRITRAVLRPLLFFVLATCILIVLFIFYTKSLQTLVDDESYSYLEEIAAQVNTNLQDRLTEHYSILDTFGRVVERNKDLAMPALLELFEKEKDSYGYQEIALIDVDGNLYSGRGKVVYSDLFPFIAKMKQEQRQVTTNVMNLFGMDCTAFLAPFSPVAVGDITLQGIIVTADMNTLTSSLSLSVFNHQGFAHVITPSGSVVMRAVNENSDFNSYNLLGYLNDDAKLEDITINYLREDLQNGKSGRIRFVQPNGIEMFAFYAPTGYEEWYLFAIIPSNILTARTTDFYRQTVLALAILTLIFMVLLIIIMRNQQQKKRVLLQTLHTDAVTGGRSMLKFELDVTSALHNTANQFSLLYANVEKFKFINEQLGRDSADQLLRYIYQTIKSGLDEKKQEYTSRLMADHFGILVRTQDLAVLRTRIAGWDHQIRDYSLQIHAPVPIRMTYGILSVNSMNEDIAVLLDRANMARKLADVRADDGARIACYDDSLKQRLLLEQELEARQDIALAAGEFKMFLQPKYNPQNNRIAGAEALVRWQSPGKGMLFPDQYIPLFESNGFIMKLDLFIFEEACRFIDSYLQSGGQPVPISVNLSRVDLNHTNFLEQFAAIWAKYQFDAKLLEFEITESLIFDNMEALDQIIAEIHKYGFRVSMDDFGSGYSSLNMLKSVGVDVIKLDRQFFLGKEEDAHKGRLIVVAMIKLCQELGIHVVAEGVETEEQVAFLRQQNCDLIQGYYYDKPMPQEHFLSKLQSVNRGE